MLVARRARLPEPVRPAHRRCHGDLRRFGGAGALRRAARASAEGQGDALHRDRRLGAVDPRDDRLSHARQALGLDPRLAGIFLGATIHDVAQVVGAGYSLSTETGDAATLVKLMRVAMLLPVIVLAALITRARSGAKARPGDEAPAAAALIRGRLRHARRDQQHRLAAARVSAGGNEISRWFLIAAIAGIGMKTHLQRARQRRFQAGGADDRRNRVSCRAGARAHALVGLTLNGTGTPRMTNHPASPPLLLAAASAPSVLRPHGAQALPSKACA